MAFLDFGGALRLAFLMYASLAALSAQTASLRGQVFDESGAVVPGASVTLVIPTGANQIATTDAAGAYLFKAMAPGTNGHSESAWHYRARRRAIDGLAASVA